MKERSTEDVVADIMGEGIHTALRKWCDSDASTIVYVGIRMMPNDEWNSILNAVANDVVNYVTDQVNSNVPA